MALHPDDDTLAEQLFEAARRERPAPEVKRRAEDAAAVRPSLPKQRWLVAALALGTVLMLVLGERHEFFRGDGAGGGPDASAIRAEPVHGPARSVSQARQWVTRGRVASAAPPSSVRSPVVAPSRSAASKPPAASLQQELEMLDAARQALLGGDTQGALARLVQYDQRATRRHLGAEATVLRIQILAASGRALEASTLASQFVAKHPNSPLVDRAKSFIRESQWGDVNQGINQGVGP